jgi:enoyl-[acyl-carrier protein] reductase II
LTNKATDRFLELQHEVIGRFRSGEFSQKEAQLAIEHYWAGALKKAAIDGDIENGSLMAGQSVGMVTKEQPTAEILAELVAQAEAAILNRAALEAAVPE